MAILDRLNNNEDLKGLPSELLPSLCREIREFLVENVSRTGGHLASNLGCVELTVALHRVYDPMKDRILFDVGHQSYVHKILTGRRELFSTLRELDGISGFPRPDESAADPIVAGHASDSISAALGMARARTLLKKDYDVVVVIGDGSLSGGMSFEGLSDAGTSGEPIVVILNDNGMSINRSVGGIAAMLSKTRLRPDYLHFKEEYRRLTEPVPGLYKLTHNIKEHVRTHLLPPGIFDEMGFQYIGPVDGHNEQELEETIRAARMLKKPVLIHAVTQKGKGYKPAEDNPELYHGVGPFDPETGVSSEEKPSFSSCFGAAAIELAEEDESVCAVTAAMESGTGLGDFSIRFPDRYFELGIAEEHAVAMCAGMSLQGLKPIFAVYSTFLQRSYDMLLENIGLMNCHVVFAVDRAGLVGHDGVTHHGCFDVAYLCTIPGMTIYAPASYAELRTMLKKAVLEETGPVAIRYPRGGEGLYRSDCGEEAETVLRTGKDISVITYGVFVNEALSAAEALAQDGIEAEIIKLNRIHPLPMDKALSSMKKTGRVLFLEDACHAECIGLQLLAEACSKGICLSGVRHLDLGDGIVSHGDLNALYSRLGLNRDGVIRTVREMNYEKDKT